MPGRFITNCRCRHGWRRMNGKRNPPNSIFMRPEAEPVDAADVDGDAAHLPARKEMKGRWRHPKKSMGWYREVQATFKGIFDLPAGFATDGSQFDRLLGECDGFDGHGRHRAATAARGCAWGRGDVTINRTNYNNFTRTSGQGGNWRWRHYRSIWRFQMGAGFLPVRLAPQRCRLFGRSGRARRCNRTAYT